MRPDVQIALPLASREPAFARPGIRARLARTGFAIAVFLAIAVGWVAWQSWRNAASPLPGGGGRQGECAIWFVGSSTILRWSTLDRDMAPWAAHNRGIGGAALGYVLRRFGNEHGVVKPGAIVFYGGENDLAEGATPATALRHLRRFLEMKTRAYGWLPVIALSIKPTPARWANRPQQIVFNAALRRLAARRDDVTYIDIVPAMFRNGRLGPFYEEDGVHMNARGYALWAPVLREALRTTLPDTVVKRCGAARSRGA